MPLRGEASSRPTYVNFERIKDGSQLLNRCEHALLGTNCVQKTVRLSRGSIASEPWLLNELDHPRITPVREAQFDPEHADFVTFVMPWYEGGSVARALIDAHHFSVLETLAIVRDVLDALEYSHTEKQYVHRDIKTDNILLNGEQSRGYLSDFGLASKLEASGTAPGVAATFAYMAPEVGTSHRHSPASDLFGVGMVLLEMLNGRIRWEEIRLGASGSPRDERAARSLRGHDLPRCLFPSGPRSPHPRDPEGARKKSELAVSVGRRFHPRPQPGDVGRLVPHRWSGRAWGLGGFLAAAQPTHPKRSVPRHQPEDRTWSVCRVNARFCGASAGGHYRLASHRQRVP